MENDFYVSSQRLCLEVKSGSITLESGPTIHRSGKRISQAEKMASMKVWRYNKLEIFEEQKRDKVVEP